jgi:hypothetical protein
VLGHIGDVPTVCRIHKPSIIHDHDAEIPSSLDEYLGMFGLISIDCIVDMWGACVVFQ